MVHPPNTYDTGSNESHHKPSKYAAKLTQRNEATFILQSAIRITEFLVLDMALYELEHGVSVQDYFGDFLDEVRKARVDDDGWDEPILDDLEVQFSEAEDDCSEAQDHGSEAAGSKSNDEAGEDEALCLELQDRPADYYLSSDEEEESDEESEGEDEDIVNGGTRIRVYKDRKREHKPTFRMLSRSKLMKDTTRWDDEVVEFLVGLQDLVGCHLPDGYLEVFTEHKRGSVLFRGHPNYRLKGYWRDWVVVDWGAGYGNDPCHIWCFVELQGMPKGRSALSFGGAALEDGVCAVVEWATHDNPETTDKITDLFTPLTLDVGEDGGRAFYLANVEAFVRTCIVIPDIGENGDPTNEYFEVKPRSLWAKEFIGWLRRPHKEDEMDWTDFEAEKLKLEEEKRRKEEEKQRKALEKEEEKQRKAQEKQRSKRRKP